MESQPNFSTIAQEHPDMKHTVIPVENPSSTIASMFSETANAAFSSAPVLELLDFHKNKFRKTMIYIVLLFSLFILTGLILLIISFVLPKCDTSLEPCKRTDLALLIMGSTFIGTGALIILLVIGCASCQFRKQMNDLTDPRITQNPIIWRYDGIEWSRFLDYIHGPNRQWTEVAPLSSFCCRQSTYNRLLDRQHGHVVLYWNGLIIDELHFVSFRQYELQTIEVMNFDPSQQIHGLRIHTYLKAGKNSRDCYFDVFAPSRVSLLELQGIVQLYMGRMSNSMSARLASLGLSLFT
ncbi:unnamed protein product [Adineta ricciae]|uniref:Uncharacterized protein n=1 Tax=Adineta ricciae TaxID=249248 RepID=A0A816DSQ9_ADIRI|nr:unnamed protein product [Adineta ricciae]CAF1637773.1 unnamed protein product [Adineta ricciae]